MKKQLRNAMTTINIPIGKDIWDMLPRWEHYPFIKRAMGQLESAPTTGKLHWQIFLEFSYSVPLGKLVKAFPGMHISVDNKANGKVYHPARGRAYVRKPTEFLNTRFDWPEDTEVFRTTEILWKLQAEHKYLYGMMCKASTTEAKKHWMKLILRNRINFTETFLARSKEKVQ